MKITLTALLRKMSQDIDLDPFSVRYLSRRLLNEGYRFLTETLPKFGKLVLASIEAGRFLRKELKFTCFAWKGALLRVFEGLLMQIFDRKTGVLLDVPSAAALKKLRQVCEYFYKLALPIEEDKADDALHQFIETDASLGTSYDYVWVDQLRKDFETHYSFSSAHIHHVFAKCKARPGSGTYSDKKKFESETGKPWFYRKHIDYALPDAYSGLGGLTKPIYSAPMQKAVGTVNYSEVLFVPKDSRGPRTIVREPYSTLRFQMGFHDWLKSSLERETHNRVNFQDQQVNRELARLSSITRENATLDLSSASDRVSASICSHIFRNSPAINYMIARRTKMTRLPNGKFLTLNKLSGMGSGLTFPLMSLLITLTVTRSIVNYTRMPYAQARKLVYVYGDDIIVPTKYVQVAIASLERVKLKVGTEKSYAKGPFRESCGGDYLCGVDVVPVRLKLSSCELSAKGVILEATGKLCHLAIERHCRELVKAGLHRTASYFYDLLEREVGRLDYVSGESPVLGRYVPDLPESWLPRDESGTFKRVRALMAIPDSREGLWDDYVYMASALLRSVGCNFIKHGFSTRGSTYNEINSPRSVRYVRRKVSALTLLG